MKINSEKILTEKQNQIFNEFLQKTGNDYFLADSRKSEIKQFMHYLNVYNIDMFNLKLADAENYQHYLVTLKNESGKSKYLTSTISQKIVVLKRFYNYLKREQKVFINPFNELGKLRRQKSLPKNIPTEKSMSRLLSQLMKFSEQTDLRKKVKHYKTHVIAELMYSTGARINEILKLKISDIDFLRGTVSLKDSKTGKERIGFLNGFCEKVLKIYIDEFRDLVIRVHDEKNRDYLFGGFCAVKHFTNFFLNEAGQKLEQGKFSSHNIRHAFGYHLLRAGCDIRYIKEFLGHKRIDATQVYTKVDKKDLKRVLDKFHPRNFKEVKK